MSIINAVTRKAATLKNCVTYYNDDSIYKNKAMCDR